MRAHRPLSSQKRLLCWPFTGAASSGKEWRSLTRALHPTADVIAPEPPVHGAAILDTADRLTWLCDLVAVVGRPVLLPSGEIMVSETRAR